MHSFHKSVISTWRLFVLVVLVSADSKLDSPWFHQRSRTKSAGLPKDLHLIPSRVPKTLLSKLPDPDLVESGQAEAASICMWPLRHPGDECLSGSQLCASASEPAAPPQQGSARSNHLRQFRTKQSTPVTLQNWFPLVIFCAAVGK